MTAGIILISIVTFFTVLAYRRTRFEQKVFKNVPLTEWITVLFFPLLVYIGWATVVKSILERPKIPIFPFDDFDILAVTMLFMVYGFVGNGIHFTSKIVWRYLDVKKNPMAYRINEMFHNKLSHYLTYLNALFIAFLLPILEVNHPSTGQLAAREMRSIVFAGSIFGISGTRAIFYTNEWFGGYNRPLAIIILILLSLVVAIFKAFHLNLDYYPAGLFVITILVSSFATFMIRQFMIFSRLNSKRRLRFIAKILSA